MSYIDKALEIDPRNVIVLNNKGFSLNNLDRNEEAIRYYPTFGRNPGISKIGEA